MCENLGKSPSLGRHFSGGISEKRVESTLPWPGRAMIMLMYIIMTMILPWPGLAVPCHDYVDHKVSSDRGNFDSAGNGSNDDCMMMVGYTQ